MQLAYKIIIPNLELFEPSLTPSSELVKTVSLENSDNVKSHDFYANPDYDFSIQTYNHFPIILNSDSTPWDFANLYLLQKLENIKIPSPKTLESIANDLVTYKRFVDENDIDYLSFPKRKLRRPTYSYRAYLQELMEQGKLSPNTSKRKMSSVIGFYRWLSKQPEVDFEYPMWNESDSYISFKDEKGFSQSRLINTTDLKVNITKSQNDYNEYIEDGGKLKPLSKQQQKSLAIALNNIGNTEMTLAFLIALTTGARIQTVFTLRLGSFTGEITSSSPLIVLTGMGTLVETKYQKRIPILIPSWLVSKIKVYIKSEKAVKRCFISSHYNGEYESQYLFLTKSGRPYYIANKDPLISKYRNPPRGDAIRQFIKFSVIPELKKLDMYFYFRFHDLRASFGLNLIEQQVELIDNGKVQRLDLIMLVKERMGHSKIATTEAYLNHRSSQKLLFQTQETFEIYLQELIYDK